MLRTPEERHRWETVALRRLNRAYKRSYVWIGQEERATREGGPRMFSIRRQKNGL
jgi:hypothetical protein